MADNKNKVDRIHDQMPKFFRTRTNPNWKSLIDAVGESDQKITDLIEEVRKQFFIKTASRPYIDRLGANYVVSRPKFVGMDDKTFRNYIPVLAYQPKQVKLVMDLLLDIFFFKETTTAFIQSDDFDPFNLVDDWELEYIVDQSKIETIRFSSQDFSNIGTATADEVASAINRQAQHSFSIVFDDRIKKKKFIRIFTNTIGSKGSIQISGGRANISTRFSGFNNSAGSGSNTQWLVTKIGDTVTFQHIAGTSPNLDKVQIGDIVISSILGNEGSFVIEKIDLSNSSFSFTNLFATTGTYDHSLLTTNEKVRFMTPEKAVVFTNNSRSVVWEVSPGQIIVEMPASPPVVKRTLAGSAHFNGTIGTMIAKNSATSLDIDDATDWPQGGQFVLQHNDEIQTHILTGSEDTVVTKNLNTRFDIEKRYTYSSKAGNTLNGITPDLPATADLYEANISTTTRVGDIVTVVTATAHDFNIGEGVRIQNVVPDLDDTINGTFIILSTPTTTSFTYQSLGIAGVNTGGVARVERIGISNSNSLLYLTSATVNSGIYGPYMWDPEATYVLSSMTSNLQSNIKAGNNARTILIDPINNIPDAEGFLVFDFGTEREEGPVRCLYKPNTSSIQLDPAYIFKNNHDIGSSITAIRRKGAHVMSGLGTEYPIYITDPASAREVLQNLMKQVKSVGIFIEFLVRYPEQLYPTLDVYKSVNPDLWPVNEEEKAKLNL